MVRSAYAAPPAPRSDRTFLRLDLLQCRALGLGQDQAVLGLQSNRARRLGLRRYARLLPRAFRRFFMFSGSWRFHTERTPKGETGKPYLANSLATRRWPQAGCSTAKSTTAASTSGATQNSDNAKQNRQPSRTASKAEPPAKQNRQPSRTASKAEPPAKQNRQQSRKTSYFTIVRDQSGPGAYRSQRR